MVLRWNKRTPWKSAPFCFSPVGSIKVRPLGPVACLDHQFSSCFLQNQVAGYSAEGESSEGTNWQGCWTDSTSREAAAGRRLAGVTPAQPSLSIPAEETSAGPSQAEPKGAQQNSWKSSSNTWNNLQRGAVVQMAVQIPAQNWAQWGSCTAQLGWPSFQGACLSWLFIALVWWVGNASHSNSPAVLLLFPTTTWATRGNSCHTPLSGESHTDATCGKRMPSWGFIISSSEHLFFGEKQSLLFNIAVLIVCALFYCFVLSVNCYLNT